MRAPVVSGMAPWHGRILRQRSGRCKNGSNSAGTHPYVSRDNSAGTAIHHCNSAVHQLGHPYNTGTAPGHPYVEQRRDTHTSAGTAIHTSAGTAIRQPGQQRRYTPHYVGRDSHHWPARTAQDSHQGNRSTINRDQGDRAGHPKAGTGTAIVKPGRDRTGQPSAQDSHQHRTGNRAGRPKAGTPIHEAQESAFPRLPSELCVSNAPAIIDQ